MADERFGDAMEAPDLDEAIAALAAALAPRLADALREDSVADVRAELAVRLTAELLRRCEAELGIAAESPQRTLGHYVYGVVRSGTPIPVGLAGVDPSAPLRLVECRGLAALVSDVPLAEFDEAGLRAMVEDVTWLEAIEGAHERVLAAVLESAALVPQRLCTVLVDEGQVHDLLSRDHGLLLDALERLGGCAEWGVKVFASPIAIEREALRRATRTEATWDADAPAAREWAREIHADLAFFAEEALFNPLQPAAVSGRRSEMLLNGVYLVDDERASDFRSVARELGERLGLRGVEIVLTGPGPAYNFVKSSIEAAR
jgi:hypothetical protein